MAQSVAVDHLGNIYVVDGNAASGQVADTVRKIALDRTVTTVLTNLNIQSRENSVRLAIDNGNNLYFIDGTYIRKLSTDGKVSTIAGIASEYYSGDGGPAINAGLGLPRAITVDSSAIFISQVMSWMTMIISTDRSESSLRMG